MIKITAPKGQAVRIASTTGVVVYLQPGESRTVQNYFAVLAAEAGCSVLAVEDNAEVAVEAPQFDKAAELQAAVKQLTEEGDPANFTASAKPRKAAVQALVDFDFTASELTQAFEAALQA